MFDRKKIGYTFVFMFASPSYMVHKTRAKDIKTPWARLQYLKEWKTIKKSISKSKIDINVHKVHGTHEEL